MTHTNTEAVSELLPCPFCGGEARNAHESGSAWFIEADHATCCHFADFQRTEAEAITAWNRRAANSAGGVEVKGRSIASAPRDGTYILARQEGVLAPSFFVVAFDQSWSDGGWWMTCDGKDPELPLRGPEPVEWWPLPGSSLAAEAEPVAWPDNMTMLESFGASGIREGSRIVVGASEADDKWEDYYEVPFFVLDAIRTTLCTHPSSPVSAEVTEAWWPEGPFKFGDRVEKPKGSSWHGKVCGWYTTSLTPVGYCVESEREPGSVQLYPVAALAALNGGRENG